jgi:hypothetical protein
MYMYLSRTVEILRGKNMLLSGTVALILGRQAPILPSIKTHHFRLYGRAHPRPGALCQACAVDAEGSSWGQQVAVLVTWHMTQNSTVHIF